MSFNVTYPAGGVIDEVKKVRAILGGIIDEVKNIDNVDKVKLLEELETVNNILNIENVNLIETINLLKEVDTVNLIKLLEEIQKIDLVETVNLVKNVENVDLVKLIEKINNIDTVNTVEEVKNIAQLRNFPKFTQPYNTMVKLDVPAIQGEYTAEYIVPDFPIELMALTVTCSGYGELDNYDVLYDDKEFFKNWYCSEVKEGLYIGTSNMVYALPANSKITLKFHNDSGTSKFVWFGIRMLKE